MTPRELLRQYMKRLREHLRNLYCQHEWSGKMRGAEIGKLYVEFNCPHCRRKVQVSDVREFKKGNVKA